MQFRIDFNIRNFLLKSHNWYKHVFWSKRLSKHKTIEFEIIMRTDKLINFVFELIFSGRDHAGPSVVLDVLGLEVSVRIYDHRHWDYQNNCWETSLTSNS